MTTVQEAASKQVTTRDNSPAGLIKQYAEDFKTVLPSHVKPDTWVANMVGQHGTRPSRSAGPPIRYEAVRACLRRLAVEAADLGASVHMPRIGCGLAGGRWDRVEPLISAELTGHGVQVTVYDAD